MNNFSENFDANKMFNGMFGKIQSGMCRLSLNGGIAVKCSHGFKTYNVKKKRLTNVTNFCIDMPNLDPFFVIPTNKVSKGDIILVDGKPKCVIEDKGSAITVIDYENSEIRQIVPERHVFMGNTYFYGKIVSFFGGANFRKGSGMKNIMKMMMMSQMFGGGANPFGGSGDNNGGGNFMQMMMMLQMFGGNGAGDLFDGLFDGISFGETDGDDDESTDDSEDENSEEE